MTFSLAEQIRYSRHFALPNVGQKGQQRLKEAKVLCIGAGGLGSAALLYLCAAGVGTIGIVDNDVVELSNLQRQVLYTTKDLTAKKADTAKTKLTAVNPEIKLIPHTLRLTTDNALELIDRYDIVVDGSDNFATRYAVNDACFHLRKPNVYASISQFIGQCSVFTTENGPCYRCLYDTPPLPHLIPDCSQGGVFGVLPGLLGTIQATEVLKLILNIGQPLIGRLLIVNALSLQFKEIALPVDPECRLCLLHQDFSSLSNQPLSNCNMNKNTPNNLESLTVQEFYALQQRSQDFLLVDVREPEEYAICNLGGLLIPLNQLHQRIEELDSNKLIIVHCKHDGRSQYAVDLLRQANFKQVKYLAGGILAWAREIDRNMPTY